MLERELIQKEAHAKSDEDVVLYVRNISKKFCKNLKLNMFYGIADLAKNLLGFSPDFTVLRKSEFWALDNINLELRKGQVLGLIGRNGSGKTTLLRLISGIYPPDKGEIIIKGRVGSLIALGAGFHPYMSGRENIYLNGAILGMNRSEVDKKIESIIEFSELGEFIDAPVASYSSGMRVRLGFSIAISLEPDIVLMDEVLAVGDRHFKAKCYNEIDKLIKNTSIVFVSHSMPSVARICTHIIVLDSGRIVYYGDNVNEGIEHYYSLFPTDESSISGVGLAYINRFTLFSEKGFYSRENVYNIKYLHTLNIEMAFSLSASIKKANIAIQIFDKEFNVVSVLRSDTSNFEVVNNYPEIKLCVSIPNIQLSTGKYYITVIIRDCESNEVLLKYHNIKIFQVSGGYPVGAPFLMQADWKYVH